MTNSKTNLNNIQKVFYSREDRVAEFNVAAGKTVTIDETQVLNELDFFFEEVEEFKEALHDFYEAFDDITGDEDYEDPLCVLVRQRRAELVKEWADCQVTLSNLAWILDIPGDEAFLRVHDNNMSKVVKGSVIRDEDTGKILKPKGYRKPSMEGL